MVQHDDMALAASRIAAAFHGSVARKKYVLAGYDPFEAPFGVILPPPDGEQDGAEPSVIYRSVSVDLFGEGKEAPPPAVIQVGGHGALQKPKDAPDCLTKEVPKCEMHAYESVQGTPLEDLFAGYAGHEARGPLYYVRLRDMTHGMARPCVMDIKMGKRTFLESEVKNGERRLDLVKKMQKLDAAALTQEEATAGITKLRYMQFREQRSSTAGFGFRIEGATARGFGYPKCQDISAAPQIANALHFFVQSRASLKDAFVQRLKAMRAALGASEWFHRHEVVGSSILFVYDDSEGEGVAGTAAAKMIDFAKTEELPDGGTLTHAAEWELGNREDGYLTGLDNLIAIWEGLEVTA